MSEGAASPFEVALDALTALVILLIVGFQWRLLIALVAELVPGLDMFPTWAAVVLSLPVAPETPKERYTSCSRCSAADGRRCLLVPLAVLVACGASPRRRPLADAARGSVRLDGRPQGGLHLHPELRSDAAPRRSAPWMCPALAGWNTHPARSDRRAAASTGRRTPTPQQGSARATAPAGSRAREDERRGHAGRPARRAAHRAGGQRVALHRLPRQLPGRRAPRPRHELAARRRHRVHDALGARGEHR